MSTDELVTLLTIEDEVELRDGLDLEGLGRLSVLVCLHGTEDNVLVAVGATSTFKSRFEPHARTAARGPEVNDDSAVVPDYGLQLHQRCDLADFTELG